MSAPRLRLKPHQAKPINGSTEAWWYEEEKSISIYIAGPDPDSSTAACVISRRYLAQWLAKTNPKVIKR